MCGYQIHEAGRLKPYIPAFESQNMGNMKIFQIMNNDGCLRIDASHQYDTDLSLRQTQWWSFGTTPVKNASFELETLNRRFFNCYISCLSNKL